jgi:hypothetical protein
MRMLLLDVGGEWEADRGHSFKVHVTAWVRETFYILILSNYLIIN